MPAPAVRAGSRLRRLLHPGGGPERSQHPAAGELPGLTGIWARATETAASVQRRLDELGRPPGEVGDLLADGRQAGSRLVDRVGSLSTHGATRWPDAALQVPADPAGRALHDRVRGLLAAQRAVLHRATLLTMPAAGDEQLVLLAGLRRAVEQARAAADTDPDPDPDPDPDSGHPADPPDQPEH